MYGVNGGKGSDNFKPLSICIIGNNSIIVRELIYLQESSSNSYSSIDSRDFKVGIEEKRLWSNLL